MATVTNTEPIRALRRGIMRGETEMMIDRPENLKVDIIICTHNRLEDLDICIKSLVDQVTTEMGHIMIVDSCSDQHIADQIVKMVETYSNVSYHRANEPGLSLARNLGIAKGASDWVAFLDDDIIADPHYFKNLVCRIDMIPNDFGIIGGQVVGQKSSGDPLPPSSTLQGRFHDHLLWRVT